jgi:hypothetical protein
MAGRVSDVIDLIEKEIGCDNDEMTEVADWFRDNPNYDLVFPPGSIAVIAEAIKRIFGN